MAQPIIPKEFLGAFKAGHRKSAREFIDEELSYKLLKLIKDSNYTDLDAIAKLTYITKFNNEFHKNVIKKGDMNALHNTDALRKDCYARENARNRDIHSLENDQLRSLSVTIEGEDPGVITLDTIVNSNRNLLNYEDTIISLMELEGVEYINTED